MNISDCQRPREECLLHPVSIENNIELRMKRKYVKEYYNFLKNALTLNRTILGFAKAMRITAGK